MERNRIWGAAFVLTAVAMAGCYTVPETGRRSLVLASPEQELQLGAQAFADIRAKETLSRDPNALARVTRVGQRIAAAVGNDLPSAQWEFVVFDSPELNAFALPGGKVGVYTGLLNLATNDDELAVVIGHEIAHVTARHGGERMTAQQAVALGGTLVESLGSSRLSPQTLQMVQLAYGGISTVGAVLPHSRFQESEADKIGLRYAARAGYDPRAAVTFWLKMNQQKQGTGAPPSFLSTHPSGDDRIADLNVEIPQVMPLYEAARNGGAGEIGRRQIGRDEIGR